MIRDAALLRCLLLVVAACRSERGNHALSRFCATWDAPLLLVHGTCGMLLALVDGDMETILSVAAPELRRKLDEINDDDFFSGYHCSGQLPCVCVAWLLPPVRCLIQCSLRCGLPPILVCCRRCRAAQALSCLLTWCLVHARVAARPCPRSEPTLTLVSIDQAWSAWRRTTRTSTSRTTRGTRSAPCCASTRHAGFAFGTPLVPLRC